MQPLDPIFNFKLLTPLLPLLFSGLFAHAMTDSNALMTQAKSANPTC